MGESESEIGIGVFMTKNIFTEKQYKLITDCFDKLAKDYNMGIFNPNVVSHMQEELFDKVDFIYDWPEIVAIANPVTRKEAKEKYVEKEKKYYWTSKKSDNHGNSRQLSKDEDGAIYFIGRVMKLGHTREIAETELREWGYNPEMFDKEEVE